MDCCRVIIFLAFSVQCLAAPNIVFVLTDDQDVAVGGMVPMQKTTKLIGDYGVTFVNAMVNTPLCCPSRSSLLSGRYVHNHATRNNSDSGGCNSRNWRKGPEKSTFIKYLHDANYTTFYAGKYLNQYGKDKCGGVEHVPPGWDWWYGLVGNSVYYNYSLSVNGSREKHYDNPRKDYLTSVIRGQALEFLSSYHSRKPFFMMLATPSPHAPFTPLPKYRNKYSNLNAPRPPNFNIKVGNDKHWFLRQLPSPLDEEAVERVDSFYRNRLRTLLSVDDMVSDVVKMLTKKNILNNTYIFFSSDHGYHLGQFSMPMDKRLPYDFDIRVPLLIRGPGIPKGAFSKSLVTLIDLAPTFLAIAGIDIPKFFDGKPLLPLRDWKDRDFLLVTHAGEGRDEPIKECPYHSGGGFTLCDPRFSCKCQDSRNNTYSCVRELSKHKSMLYCEFKDDENMKEVYDLWEDPYQLHNIAGHLDPSVIHYYRSVLNQLLKCSGSKCHLRERHFLFKSNAA